METGPSPLDTFDHVVVLMLENRSFDNILGYLYRDGVPDRKTFEGVVAYDWGPGLISCPGRIGGVADETHGRHEAE
jgi:Phosphoesterase family